jgi:FixJ family two-component response regulator
MVSHGTVFLVDDDEALRRATTRMLTASGFEVRGFASAEEYLAGLDAAAAGCLLLDLRLPGSSAGAGCRSCSSRATQTCPRACTR